MLPEPMIVMLVMFVLLVVAVGAWTGAGVLLVVLVTGADASCDGAADVALRRNRSNRPIGLLLVGDRRPVVERTTINLRVIT
ncbi:hypothetical protein GCM10022262_17670 [Georgenia daeguensis]|uniref:Secreted protein n=1 Tax=Georgenia daeguensis TaxID=908355 RepID=A0ABP8ETY0_9MICO